MRALLSLLIGVSLLGCATQPGDRTARMGSMPEHRKVEFYGPICERQGHKIDSEPWRKCIASLDEQDLRDRYASYPSLVYCFLPKSFFRCI